MKLKMNSSVSGTNYLHWVHPWERDTTRGGVGDVSSVFPTMHANEIQATVRVAQCQCCGVAFGFMEPGKPKDFCPGHSWLSGKQSLGKLYLSSIKYQDRDRCEVVGRMIRYSYFFPEENQRDAEHLCLGLRTWLVEEYLEQVGIDRLPKVVKVEKGVWVIDLHRLQHEEESDTLSRGAPISSQTLERLMERMDQVYVESL